MQRALDVIGGKWKMSILCSLVADGPTRYNDIKRKMSGISDTMLAKSLKEMENDGLIKRKEYMEVPIRVEYEVTDTAKALVPILTDLAAWGGSLSTGGSKSAA